MKKIIKQYFTGEVTIEQVCREAQSEGLSADELIQQMSQWKILLESEHAESLSLLTKEAEAAIKAIMGEKK